MVEAVVPQLLAALAPGALIVDMSSSDPVSTRRLGDRAREAGVGFVDAPVSGGVAGAEAGTLTAMVGGTDCDVRAVGPLLDAMADTRFHVGGPGAGHAVKALNNLLSAAGIAITTEAIAIGSGFGVDPARMIEVFNASTGRNCATEYKFPEFVLRDRWASGFASASSARTSTPPSASPPRPPPRPPRHHHRRRLARRRIDPRPRRRPHRVLPPPLAPA